MRAIISRLLSWISRHVSSDLFDTHFHILTPSYMDALERNGGDISGWPSPKWSIEGCEEFCSNVGISFAVLSITAPGPAIEGPTDTGRRLARKLNDEVWAACQRNKQRFGFFACLPDFRDVAGVLAEIEYVCTEQRGANGFIVLSSYGDNLVGDKAFSEIWNLLNKHKALVFLHPGHAELAPEKIAGYLPQPVVDYPQATTRAAVSLILSGTMNENPSVDIILSHAGGTLPYLSQRIIGSLIDSNIAAGSQITLLQAKKSLDRFYYDLALATSTAQLRGLLSVTSPSHVLYGSDYPYAPLMAIYGGFLQYAQFAKSKEGASVRPAKLRANAQRLLKCHAYTNTHLPNPNDPSMKVEENDTQSEHSGAKDTDEPYVEARKVLSRL